MHENQSIRAGFHFNLQIKEESMNECSLTVINNEPCHRAIREGKCPGAAGGQCVNETAIILLVRRYEKQAVMAWSLACAKKREEKASFPSHFIDQNDLEKRTPKSIQTTLTHLSRLIKRVHRIAHRNIAQRTLIS